MFVNMICFWDMFLLYHGALDWCFTVVMLSFIFVWIFFLKTISSKNDSKCSALTVSFFEILDSVSTTCKFFRCGLSARICWEHQWHVYKS